MSNLKYLPLPEYQHHTETGRPQRRTVSVVKALTIATLTVIAVYHLLPSLEKPIPSSPVEVDQLDGHGFNWTSVGPSNELTWTPCYEDFECAKFLVPLDYSDPKAGKAAIAMTRYPSPIPRDNEAYRGPILFNPGGPGGSGVELILGNGKAFRKILGDGYDLIGFDPRGIGFTTPALRTLQSRAEDGTFLTRFQMTMNSSNAALGQLWATARTLGDLAQARMGDVAQYVGTPVVARDLLSIVNAHGLDKLQYWGFSYGTVIGATFAAMFPDKVGRIVIDGVVDSEDFYATSWSHNLQDADATLFNLWQACVDAGPSACFIWEESAEAVHTRYVSLLSKIRENPVTFYNLESGAYGVVDYSLVLRSTFNVLSRPHFFGKLLTMTLAALEQGIAEPIFQLSEMKEAQGLLDQGSSCPASPRNPWRMTARENPLAIGCGDGEPLHDDLDSLKVYFDEQAQISKVFAEVWWPRIGCAAWKVRGKERFSASFKTNTSFPLLVIGNTYDPITPIQNARKMSQGFKDSVLLTQDSAGHCSIAAVSLCTAKAIRAYFQDGVLPVEGTVCNTESSIFGGPLGVSARSFGGRSRGLLNAWHDLQQNYFVPVL